MSNPITLYDLLGSAAKDIAWSTSAWRVRFALNIKGLPYKTSWLEFPDIKTLAEQIGAEQTPAPMGGLQYSVPIIQDPNTSSVVSDSFRIVRYLDKAYPDTPRLIPEGTEALQLAFVDMCMEKIALPAYQRVLVHTMKQLSPRGQEYWRKTREAAFGAPLEEIAPEGSERRAELWKEVIAALTTVNQWWSAQDGVFVMGDKPTLADLVVASLLTWQKRLLGEDSAEWKEILQTDGGRWGRLVAALQKWETVDEEGLRHQTNA